LITEVLATRLSAHGLERRARRLRSKGPRSQ
jgi:hypothetical protein